MIALVLSLFSALEASPATRAAEIPNRTEKAEMQQHPYIGMWVTGGAFVSDDELHHAGMTFFRQR